MEIKIKRNLKKYNEYAVNMKLTQGAVLALHHALVSSAAAGSAVSEDLVNCLERAGQEEIVFTGSVPTKYVGNDKETI